MENLKIESVICAPASLCRRYENRQSHALVLRPDGGSRYDFDGIHMTLGAGDMLFIPKGTSYTVRRVGQQPQEYCLINFNADIPRGKPTVFPISEQISTDSICARLRQLRVITTQTERYRLMALFFELIACACQSHGREASTDARMRLLAPAMTVLQKSVFDPELRISQLPGLCGMSDTYFRALFVDCYGVTPKKYILGRRLAHAKALLDNGEYDSITQAARLSGFEDPLYFSKVFKNHYGYPPTKSRCAASVR